MTFESWLLFSAIALIATITPGPAIMLVSANSSSYGVRKSIYTILGNISGLFCMSLMAVLGLSTLILCSAPIFFTLKIIGALYLFYLGLKMWRNGISGNRNTSSDAMRLSVAPRNFKLYMQGVFLSLSNPKAIAFTTALFPQFIQPELPLAPQFIILVSTFMFFSFSCLLGYSILARKAKKQFEERNYYSQTILGKVFGTIFIGSGVALAVATRK
jgi:threonine/homoserine/homoserine lactone efflux protein